MTRLSGVAGVTSDGDESRGGGDGGDGGHGTIINSETRRHGDLLEWLVRDRPRGTRGWEDRRSGIRAPWRMWSVLEFPIAGPPTSLAPPGCRSPHCQFL